MRVVSLLVGLLAACNPDEPAGPGDGGQADGGGEAICEDVWYADADGDGYGDVSRSEVACDAPSGFVADATDCDDAAASTHPGATEYCDDVDTDCDGLLDNDADDVSTFYVDADGDTFGSTDESIEACDRPFGYAENADDCDDADPYASPSAPEYCDGVDNDCDGETDEDDDVTDPKTWYLDEDGDGYGIVDVRVLSCDAPDGYATVAFDCDDTEPSTHPDADEYCDGVDNDCNGIDDDDDALDVPTWYEDGDGDGFGDPDRAAVQCEPPSDDSVLVADDCDDTDKTVYLGAVELCDEQDNDCDGDVDEAEDVADPTVWYRDADGDGYGDPDVTEASCDQPTGYIGKAMDCDDTDPTIGPGGDETWYDGVDTDCDGASDYDADRDGYDADAYGGKDCDDTDAETSPDGTEYCDGVDNDCDGETDPDDSVDASTYYRDADEDGYGDPDVSTTACETPSGYVDNDHDCDDSDAKSGSCSSCGDEVVDEDEGEEYDPPPGPFSNVEVDSDTCRWDFSGVNQLYCNGACSWAGTSGCDAEDADILCKLITGNPDSEAESWTDTTALAEEGFPCAPLGSGTAVNIVDRGLDSVKVTWSDTSILASHGAGNVIAYPSCTDP